MLLHKTHLMIGKLAGNDVTRPQLAGIHVSAENGETHATVTDGHKLLRVSRPTLSDADWPKQKDATAASVGPEGVILPTAACATALKSIPKKSYPILESNARLEQAPVGVALVATDLDTTSRIDARPIDSPYPNTEQIFPKGEPTLKIAVNAEYLRDLCDVIAKLHRADGDTANSEMRLTFYSVLDPIKIEATLDNGRVVGLLMPLSMEKSKRVKAA